MAWQRICRSDALADGECLEFVLATGEGGECFLLRRDGRLFAYRNRCPHTGATLNWMPNTFLNPEGDLIQCALHGALFSIEDGRCLHGPCNGRPLSPLQVKVEHEGVWVHRPVCTS